LIATAAPIAVPSSPTLTADPSPLAKASVLAEVFTLTRPPAEIVRPSANQARERVIAMLTLTAAATLTPPSEVDAVVSPPSSPAPSLPLSCAKPSPKLRSLLIIPVTPPDVESCGSPLLESSAGAPAAEAIASPRVSDEPKANTLTAPPAVMLRALHASTVWCAIVRTNATPTDVSPPSVSPRARPIACAVCCARKRTKPVTSTPLPAPRDALVVTLVITIEIAGAMAVSSADAPVFASVNMPFVVVAVTLRSCPPISVPSIAAVVLSSMTAIETDAPTPTDPAPLTPVVPSAGSAVVLVVESEAAATLTLPSCASTLAPVGITADVCILTMLIATEPAMPTSPAPAPLEACDANSWTECIVELIVTPCALMTAFDGIETVLMTLAELIATPTPIEASPPSAVTALPSARAVASVSAVVVSENAPVEDVIDTPLPSEAREMVWAMFTPIAAATETPPSSESSVSAFGVSDESPSPEPPLSCDIRSAKPRWLSTCCVTPLVLESAGSPLLVSSSGAPAALAIAPDELSDDPSA